MVAQEEQTVFAELRDNLISNGAQIDGISVLEHDTGERGLVATRRLMPDQIVLHFPYRQLISGRVARATPVIAQIMQAVKDDSLSQRLPDVNSDIAAITLYLLLEIAKGDNSMLKPWLRTLPAEFSTPLTEDEDEVYEMLSGSPVLYLVMRLREELREMYDEWILPYAVQAHPSSFPGEVCTFEQFMYVHSVCDSRSFEVDGVTMLAPYADMANHRVLGSSGVNLRVRGWKMADQPDELGMEIYVSSTEPVPAGTELCISYGPLANGQLLMHYGFAVPENPADCLPISLQFPEDDSMHVQTKKLILQNLDSTGLISLNHELSLADPLPASLLASTRLLVMDEQEIEPVTIQNANFALKISARNEVAVKTQLGKLFENMLNDYPIPLDADELNEGSLEYYCLIYMGITTSIIRKARDALNALP